MREMSQEKMIVFVDRRIAPWLLRKSVKGLARRCVEGCAEAMRNLR